MSVRVCGCCRVKTNHFSHFPALRCPLSDEVDSNECEVCRYTRRDKKTAKKQYQSCAHPVQGSTKRASYNRNLSGRSIGFVQMLQRAPLPCSTPRPRFSTAQTAQIHHRRKVSVFRGGFVWNCYLKSDSIEMQVSDNVQACSNAKHLLPESSLLIYL
jgi:hypothetical protein